MFKFILTFGAGVYTGIYVSQNYEVPKVDDPTKIFERIKEIAEEHRKNHPGRRRRDPDKSE